MGNRVIYPNSHYIKDVPTIELLLLKLRHGMMAELIAREIRKRTSHIKQ